MTVESRRIAIRCKRAGGGLMPVIVPWLMAPLFMLMPMGGCALAGKLRQPAPQALWQPPLVPIEAVVTANRE